MASSINEDDSKVMDISKPGKGKLVPTSRPVVSPIVSDDKNVPPISRKVIKPLNDEIVEGARLTPINSSEGSDSPVNNNSELESGEESEANTSIESSAKPDSTQSPGELTDDAASVNAIAEAVEVKKQAAKKAEEQAKIDAEISKLTESKKYFVPIGHSSGKSASKSLVFIVVLVAIIAVLAGGAYYWITQHSDSGNTKSPSQSASSAQNGQTERSKENNDGVMPESLEPNSRADIMSRDANRKDELKNLQRKLEAYFNDNNEYPAVLSELSLSEDELVGPSEDVYIYITPDQQSYVLSAELENGEDQDVDENGLFTLQSVNQ